jgi:hypothetical protein
VAVTGKQVSKSGMTTGMLLASAVGLLALPSAVLAFSTRFEPKTVDPVAEKAGDSMDPGIAAGLIGQGSMRSLAKGQLYPFTPAGTPNRPNRSVTVAVRVDPATAQAILVRGVRLPPTETPGTALRIAPTAFALGVARGYHNFAQELVPPDSRKSDSPDLGLFSIAPGKAANPRFNPRIVMDEKPAAGRAPRTFAGEEDRVDVGGSYRLTRNLDVTAGVRYSQDRERLRPLTDGKQDSQAVYLGTQFRF